MPRQKARSLYPAAGRVNQEVGPHWYRHLQIWRITTQLTGAASVNRTTSLAERYAGRVSSSDIKGARGTRTKPHARSFSQTQTLGTASFNSRQRCAREELRSPGSR